MALETESRIFADAKGPGNLYGVFEETEETGDLYLYEPDGRGIVQWLQVYQKSPLFSVEPGDAAVVWSEDFDKVGVLIWGGLRAIIDTGHGREGRITIKDRNTPPINDPEWLKGFEWLWKTPGENTGGNAGTC
jgi:hypothetical protein